MSSASLKAAGILLCLAGPAGAAELKICADPNNLPFSNEKGEGFENKIAAVIARDLGREPSYTWWAARRGFIRNTLQTGACDLIPGVVRGMEMVATTRPYYRSRYVFVSRAADHLDIASFDDPRLRRIRIGVPIIGDDGSNAPPAHALARRNIVANLHGYTVYGDYAQPNPAGRIVAAVAAGEVDIAIVWGPFAGYFAQHQPVALSVMPSARDSDGPALPMAFDIAMGLRKSDHQLKDEIDAALQRRRGEIDAILAAYGVPREVSLP